MTYNDALATAVAKTRKDGLTRHIVFASEGCSYLIKHGDELTVGDTVHTTVDHLGHNQVGVMTKGN